VISTENQSFAEIINLTRILFGSRWLQLPLYLGLITEQCVYVYFFCRELIELILEVNNITETDIMLMVLSLIDVVVISNLIFMVIVGGL